jgi:hypothetical protein
MYLCGACKTWLSVKIYFRISWDSLYYSQQGVKDGGGKLIFQDLTPELHRETLWMIKRSAVATGLAGLSDKSSVLKQELVYAIIS